MFCSFRPLLTSRLTWRWGYHSYHPQRKVLKNSVINSAQLSLVSSGISWYHFNPSPFSNPWKIRPFAPASSWFTVAIDSNLQYQSSTSCFLSPWNRLYLSRVEGTIGLSRASPAFDSPPDPSTPPGAADPDQNWLGTALPLITLERKRGDTGRADLLGPVPRWDSLIPVVSTLQNRIRPTTACTRRSRMSLPLTTLESPTAAPKTCGNMEIQKSPDWRVLVPNSDISM